MMKANRWLLLIILLSIAGTDIASANNIIKFGMHISRERNETVENFTTATSISPG
jgi:hypothetical protein